MPIIALTIGADGGVTDRLSSAVADASARALDLQRGDVIVMTSIAESTAESFQQSGGAGWIVATVHASDRGNAANSALERAIRDAVSMWAEESGTVLEGVWVSWCLKQ